MPPPPLLPSTPNHPTPLPHRRPVARLWLVCAWRMLLRNVSMDMTWAERWPTSEDCTRPRERGVREPITDEGRRTTPHMEQRIPESPLIAFQNLNQFLSSDVSSYMSI